MRWLATREEVARETRRRVNESSARMTAGNSGRCSHFKILHKLYLPGPIVKITRFITTRSIS